MLTKIKLNLGLLSLFLCFNSVTSQNNDIFIQLGNEVEITLFETKISIDEIAPTINSYIEDLAPEDKRFQTVTISLGASITDDFLELVKEQIKQTPVRFMNVQRSIISNFNQANPITDVMISQYNTLIKGWNSKEEHERYFRKIELDFVEGVSKRMSFQQQLKAEKLPGYLPFVKQPEAREKIEMQDYERWQYDDSYRIFVNFKEVDKSYIQAKQPIDFENYYVMRKLENEQRVNEVYLTETN